MTTATGGAPFAGLSDDELEWFPMYGAWCYVFASDNGLQAIIGTRKAVSEVAA